MKVHVQGRHPYLWQVRWRVLQIRINNWLWILNPHPQNGVKWHNPLPQHVGFCNPPQITMKSSHEKFYRTVTSVGSQSFQARQILLIMLCSDEYNLACKNMWVTVTSRYNLLTPHSEWPCWDNLYNAEKKCKSIDILNETKLVSIMPLLLC